MLSDRYPVLSVCQFGLDGSRWNLARRLASAQATLCYMGTSFPLKRGTVLPPQFLAHVYCGQMAGWINVPLGMKVGLGPGHTVRCEPSPQFSAHVHRESKKGCHPNHGYVNSWSICKILSLLQTAVNFQQNRYRVTHHTLSMLLHYLGKLKNQKFALCMLVKHISSVIFYHLSKRYLPNVKTHENKCKG